MARPFSKTTAFAACVWAEVQRSPNVASAVQAATRILEYSGIPEPDASAEYIATASFKAVRSRAQARTYVARPKEAEITKFINLCQTRERTRMPIQYLVGDWDFHNVTLLVRPPVLIPRPETEELVEHVLRNVTLENAHILDVGCGSGAILLAALAARRGWSGIGLDIAPEAIALSKENLKLLGLESRGRIMLGSVWDVAQERVFDALVSNPPYIPAKEIEGLEPEVKDHEDYRALCGGVDGLDVVREILYMAPKVVKRGGSIWLEVDPMHPSRLEGMQFEGVKFVEKFDDVYGRPRFCHLQVVE